ncbi:MAG: threonine synthase [Gemmatimonadota bacterium]|nr:threonine synthase [Gemmatimonadota bacterium]
MHWTLECSNCSETRDASGLPTVCPECGDPWLVKYDSYPGPEVKHRLGERPWDMWRYREWMPIQEGEEPVSLGEGMTPLIDVPYLEHELGLSHVWVKDEGQNPCGSFKSRGMSAAVTRAHLAGARAFTVPTAGNAGVSLAAYGRRAGAKVIVFAPETTPARILEQIRLFGAELHLVDGHIGDCGKKARELAQEIGAVDGSTLREPYRIEGKKTMGLELAEQFDWALPDTILYPTGGGTGLIGMWKAFNELRDAGWISGKLPRMYSVQASGCAPVVKAFEQGDERTEVWQEPETIASGLRVPGPLGGKIMLEVLRESGGAAVAVSDEDLDRAAKRLAGEIGVDTCPEGGAAVSALGALVARGDIKKGESTVIFNTGAGWLYR